MPNNVKKPAEAGFVVSVLGGLLGVVGNAILTKLNVAWYDEWLHNYNLRTLVFTMCPQSAARELLRSLCRFAQFVFYLLHSYRLQDRIQI